MHSASKVIISSDHKFVDKFKPTPYVKRMKHDLDAIGLLCPLPVLKARKRLKALEIGDELHVLADDPAAVIDVPHFCNESGYTLVSIEEVDSNVTRYIIQKT